MKRLLGRGRNGVASMQECGKDFSSEAKACPYCGADNLKTFADISNNRKLPFLLLLSILCFPLAIAWLWLSKIYVKDGEYGRSLGPGRKIRYTLLIFSAWAAVILLVDYALSDGPAFSAQAFELPRCDAEQTIDLLKSAIANSPRSKIVNMQLLDVTQVHEASWSEADQVRTCSAHGFTNGGELPIAFELKWVDRAAGKWWPRRNLKSLSSP